MQSSFSGELFEAFGAASAALAQAEERLALFPEPELLRTQIRMAEQEALAWLEGEPFILEQLAVDYGYSPRAWRRWPFVFVRVFDRPLPARSLPTARTVLDWLNPAEPAPSPALALTFAPILANDDRLALWERQVTRLAPLPRLVAGADMAASFARLSPLPHGNAVVGAMIAERHCLQNSRASAGGIAAIGLKARRTPWRALVRGDVEDDFDALSKAPRDARCRLAWLQGLTAGALAIIELDKRTRLWLRHLDTVCAARRKSSHLRALALFAGSGPSLTVARAAAHLRLSRQATTRLVAEACKTHLLREVTHGNAFRRYVIAA